MLISRLLALVAAVAVAAVVSAPPASPQSPPPLLTKRLVPQAGRTLDGRLQARAQEIRRSFLEHDADALRRLLSEQGRIYLALPDLVPSQGFYGTSQVHAIFAKIGRETRTEKFEFGADDITQGAPRVAYLKSRWTHRTLAGDLIRTETLYFSLKDESGEWRIAEIKTAR